MSNKSITIKLESISSNYIDLAKYDSRKLVLTGRHEGDRIVLKNLKRKELCFRDAVIDSNHLEDALCVDGPAHDSVMYGTWHLNGALSFWDRLEDMQIVGLESNQAHTGIRATKDVAHRNVVVSNCKISDCRHEGIYFGPVKESKNKSEKVDFVSNQITNPGWDGIQNGNCRNTTIRDNIIINPGHLQNEWQGYGITLKSGSLAYLQNNIIEGKLQIQILDSRAFFQ